MPQNPAVKPLLLRIAVPTPLPRLFDYLPTTGTLSPVGSRVIIPFGTRQLTGVVVAHINHTDVPSNKLKPINKTLDEQPLLDTNTLKLLHWTANYYHHPLGNVIHTALPAALTRGEAAVLPTTTHWQATATGQAADSQTLKRAPKQAALLTALKQQPIAANSAQRNAFIGLEKRGWATRVQSQHQPQITTGNTSAPRLHPEQAAAIAAINQAQGKFQGFLLDGVTGSGKTEVYLQAMQTALAAKQQVLVLVPEIGLTPQLVQRFTQRLNTTLTVFHSGLSDRDRLTGWLHVRSGAAQVIIGTRSAVFTPLHNPGLLIVDEEHDASFTQQDGLRYSARDLALVRAQQLGIPVVLGSATPALETLQNAQTGRLTHLRLTQRAGKAQPPALKLLDIRNQPLHSGLSPQLLTHMRETLARGEQVLLFLNRRGYAPALICHTCGWQAKCQRCDMHLTLHRRTTGAQLHCHHCDHQRRAPTQCPDCHSVDLLAIGHGTARLEETLQQQFPDTELLRIDRDVVRTKQQFDQRLAQARDGQANILFGTQMLAKGHHFPNVTLVGIVEADQGLYSLDFRAQERLAQQIVQVAGRAGRAEKPGTVLIQTHQPEHTVLQTLIRDGYAAFAQTSLTERQAAGWPPFAHLALLRAEAQQQTVALAFLQQAASLAQAHIADDVQILGPAVAPMPRRAGRYRAQLLLRAPQRAGLHSLLKAWLPTLYALPAGRKVRWSLDVDPIDLY